VSRLEKILGFSATISGWIGQWAVLAMVVLIMVGVTFRYVLNLPLAFDAEYTGYLLAVISLVGAAYALKAGSHVRVDILLRSLSPRIQHWLQVITDIISLACIGLLLYHSWNLAYSNLVRGVTSVTPMETPLGLIQMILPLGWTLFLLQLLIEFSRSLRTARSPKGKVKI
jgi:TRAP-type C4-dicarboxylate transport system permease small subunit